MRYSREQMFMDFARAASRRSTCCRLNVGAIVTHENNVVSIGYNGSEPGAPHCAGNSCVGMTPGMCPALHAEHNALTKAAKLMPEGLEIDLYQTHSPCAPCSLLIRNSGLYVKRIFFEIPYRSTQHLGMFAEPYRCEDHPDRLRETTVYEATPAGYIVEYFTRKVVQLP
jgi:dCMP deaminase